MGSPDSNVETITGLSYRRIEEYSKDFDRTKAINDLEDDVRTDRYGFIIHEANDTVQST